MKWPYLILWSPWECCNCIKTANPCSYNCYRCLSLSSPLCLFYQFPLSPHILPLKSSKSAHHNLLPFLFILFYLFLSSQSGARIISHYVFVDLFWGLCLFFSPEVHNVLCFHEKKSASELLRKERVFWKMLWDYTHLALSVSDFSHYKAHLKVLTL